MTEFQEKLRQQHEESMHRELEALVQTAGPAQAEVSSRGNKPTRNTAVEKEEEDDEEEEEDRRLCVRGRGGGYGVTICHNMLPLVAFREQIFDEVVLSCSEVALEGREASDPADTHTHTHARMHTRTRSRNRTRKPKSGEIVEVCLVARKVTISFIIFFFLPDLQKRL